MPKKRDSGGPSKTRVKRQLERIARARGGLERHDFLKDLVLAQLEGKDVWAFIESEMPLSHGVELTPGYSNLKRKRLLLIDDLQLFYDRYATEEDDILITFPSESELPGSKLIRAHYTPRIDWRFPRNRSSGSAIGTASSEDPADRGTQGGRSPGGRAAELGYLNRLIRVLEDRANCYSPLRGKSQERAGTLLFLPPEIRTATHITRHGTLDSTSYEDALDAFEAVTQAVVLGAPGAGKSTFLYRRTVDLAEKAKHDEHAPLPLFANLGDWTRDEPFGAFLSRSSEIGATVIELSDARRVVLLLDELNQMPLGKWRAKAHEIVKFKQRLNADTPVYVSCRLNDYGTALDLGLDTLTLEPLSPLQVRKALHLWETVFGRSPEDAEHIFWQLAGARELEPAFDRWVVNGGDADEFWLPGSWDQARRRLSWTQFLLWKKHIPAHRSLLRLASNPFMFAMFYGVAKPEGESGWAEELPKNKGALFSRFIDCLLDRQELLQVNEETGEVERTRNGELLLAGLRRIAWHMQKNRASAKQIEFDIARDEALGLVAGDKGLLKKAVSTSLLEGEELLRFRHQLLQEFFVAQALEERLMDLRADELWPEDRWWERNGWEEAYVLLAGFYRSDCTSVIRGLADTQPEVAAQCIVESGSEIADRDGLLLLLRAAWSPRMTDSHVESRPEARAAVGRALGRLRFSNGLPVDNRPGVGVRVVSGQFLPDIAWVAIPGGKFIYQDSTESLPPFAIARYPITNIQFEAFCDDKNGYGCDEWWKGMEHPERDRVAGEWDYSNHPRETVSWYEATAFCRWLSSRLGYHLGLPTQRQWERAARGPNGREYRWGDGYKNGYANTTELDGHDLGQTSPVGCYPQGATKLGIAEEPIDDLHGNVWEWCAGDPGGPGELTDSGNGSRVMRGGSWLGRPIYARAVYSYEDQPLYRVGNVGFRIVRAHPHRFGSPSSPTPAKDS